MAVAIILLTFITVISIIIGINYRQQVKSISHQLNFLKRHETNMIVTGNCESHSITELINEINDFLSDMVKRKKEYMDKQKISKAPLPVYLTICVLR